VTRTPPPPASRRERRAQARRDLPAERPRSARRPSREPLWRSPIALVSAAAVVLAVVFIVFGGPAIRGTAAEELTIPSTIYSPDLVDGEVLGSATAPVVIEVFSDFQCPACRMFITEQLPRLLTDFVRPGILRIESKDIDVLGKGEPDESLELAAGARCAAEQDRYWQFHDLVFWNQGRENRGDHDAAFIARVADQAALDRTRWDACLARADVRQAIHDQTSSALAAGVTSTPTLRINGQVSVGVPDYDRLAALIGQLAAAGSPAVNGSAIPAASGAASAAP
jgi:protein-disulfide isomerase